MKKIFLLSILLFQLTFVFGQQTKIDEQEEFCKALVYYRDNTLLDDYMKNYVDIEKFKLKKELRSDLYKIKQELLEDATWQVSSNGRAVAGTFRTVSFVCDIILTTVPVGKGVSVSQKTILEGLKDIKKGVSGKSDQEILASKLENKAKKEIETVFTKLDPKFKDIVSSVNIITGLYKIGNSYVKDMKTSEEDWKELRKTLTEQVLKLDNQIKSIDFDLASYGNSYQIIYLKNEIDNYLRNNCTANNITSNRDNRSGIISSNKSDENKQNNRSGIFGTTPKKTAECTAKQ